MDSQAKEARQQTLVVAITELRAVVDALYKGFYDVFTTINPMEAVKQTESRTLLDQAIKDVEVVTSLLWDFNSALQVEIYRKLRELNN